MADEVMVLPLPLLLRMSDVAARRDVVTVVRESPSVIGARDRVQDSKRSRAIYVP